MIEMRGYMNIIAEKIAHRRKELGITQKELAEKSGVNIRMIQQYESRVKDINKAAVITVMSLSKVLGCQVEDLMENTAS